MTELSNFIDHHCLSDEADTARIELGLTIFQRFYSDVMEHIDKYEAPSKRHEFLSEAYKNMVGRLHEHTSGMFVCLATKNAPSSEALARIVLETSINLLFMLQGDREKAFLAYCDAWFISHERQLKQWLEYENKLEEATGNIPLIENRRSLLSDQKTIINKIASDLGMNRAQNYRDAYPKSLFKRFEKLEKESSYYTSYHRLSSSSHILAEDTISWLLGIMQGDVEKLFEMSHEAVAYSQMMCLIVLVTAIEAIGVFAIAHDYLDCVPLIQQSRKELYEEIEKLSNQAGVPQL